MLLTIYYISQDLPYIEAFKKKKKKKASVQQYSKECKEYFWGQSTLIQCLANKPQHQGLPRAA